jgi:RHS repeat-associated protein
LSGTFEGAGGIGGLLARSDNTVLITQPSAAHAFYHADGNGNITCLINSQGANMARYLHDPYGRTLSQSGPLAAANLYRFSSKEFHVNSGTYYYLYRFYDPGLQRSPNRDPLGEPGFEVLSGGDLSVAGGGPNLYEFVDNNPVGQFDAEGLEPCNATEIATCQARAAKRGWNYTGCTAYVLRIPCIAQFRLAKCSYTEPPPKLKKCYYACPFSSPVYTEQFPGQFSGGCPQVRAPDKNGKLVICPSFGPF